MNNANLLRRWTVDKAKELYNIDNWSGGYFSISDDGAIEVGSDKVDKEKAVSLVEIMNCIKDMGMQAPVLLRFEHILDAQLASLNNSFAEAIKDEGYKGEYRGVFPIKVNQEQQVVEEVAKYGQKFHHGFEVGSKAELIAALAEIKDKEACLICNGYKDEEFIDLGLNAIMMGFKCFFIIEMPRELDIIIDCVKKLKVKPNIGIRIKLSSVAGGHWAESSGDRSIFGLNISQLTEVVDKLKQNDMLDSLLLLHCHIGSQVPNIRDIRAAIFEASRVYAELVKEGAKMGYIDIGGGLAVDYDGSHTNFESSRNYSIPEYCADVVQAVMETMDKTNIDHPTIITESGRWVVAYYSVLVFNVLDTMKFESYDIPETLGEDTYEPIVNLLYANQTITMKNLQECYNDALYYRDQIREAFRHGSIGLRELSLGEKIFWNTINKVVDTKKNIRVRQGELDQIERAVTDIYYCNFSLFQSIPDSWAIDHLFPIMPIQRLDECPTRNAVLADITCDCDGKIDKFTDPHDIKRSLPLHELTEEEYYLGAFLVGAYQETLGALHNLFGDTNVVSVKLDSEGGFDIARQIRGDTVSQVLSCVEYDIDDVKKKFRETADGAVASGYISNEEREKIVETYERGLEGYTYYEK